MNNTFSLQRFGMLFKKHTIEHIKTYLMSVAVVVGLLFLILGFSSYTNNRHLGASTQVSTFIIFMLLGGSIFTSMTFMDLGDKKKSISYLTLPASHFEKFLVSWIYTYVLFQVTFIGAFYLVDYIIISTGAPVDTRSGIINVFSADEKTMMVFSLYGLLHGIVIWGAVFFEKLHFIKTAFIFFIGLILLVLINNQMVKLFIGSGMESVPFQGLNVNTPNNYWHLMPAEGVRQFGSYVLYAVIALLWVSAFFRLKEKEV